LLSPGCVARSGLGVTGRGIVPRSGDFEWWMPRMDGIPGKQRRRPCTSMFITPIAESPAHAIKSLQLPYFAELRGECEQRLVHLIGPATERHPDRLLR